MNAVWNSYGQLCGCPEIFKKSCKFFYRELDIRVSQIMEAKMRKPSPVQAGSKAIRNIVRSEIYNSPCFSSPFFCYEIRKINIPVSSVGFWRFYYPGVIFCAYHVFAHVYDITGNVCRI